MAGRVLVLGARTVDLDSGQVSPEGGTLRRLEQRLLEYLAERPGTFVSYEELLREVWGYAAGARTRTIYSTVYRLRSAIEQDARSPCYLVSSAGEGVCLRGASLSLAQPGRSGPAGTGNVRSLPDDFVGRRRELDWLGTDEPAVRVLWGPGGAGKTRLALEYAIEASPRFPGGVWLCDLSALQTAREVEAALSRLLGEEGQRADTLGTLLGGLAPTLVILDNHESLEEDLAPALQDWVEQGPRVRWLVTSRVPLGLAGERQIAVGGLVEEEAVALLEARIGQADPARAPSADALRSLAQALDGLPLALEIAAPHAARLTVEGVLETLQQAGDLPNDRRSVPARHRSLGQVARWSIERLSPPDQGALAALGAFATDFDLDGAAAVTGRSRAEASSLLAQLAASSLLRAVPAQRPGAARFALYATVRAVLGAPDEGALDRYVDHFARKAAQWLEVTGGLAERAMPEPELLAALERALSRGHPQLAELLAVTLKSAPADQSHALAERAMTLPLPQPARLTARLRWADVLVRRGRTLEGLALFEGLAEEAAQCGLYALAARAEIEHAVHLHNQGQNEAAERALDRATSWNREQRAPPLAQAWFEARLLLRRGLLAPVPQRTPWHERALVAAEKTADPALILVVRDVLAQDLRYRGRPAEAETHLVAVLQGFLTMPNRRQSAGEAAVRVAHALIDLERPQEAVAYATQSLELLNRSRWLHPYVLGTRARAWLALHDLQAAEADAREAVRVARLLDNPYMQVMVDQVSARVDWQAGRGDIDQQREIRDRAQRLGAVYAASTAAAAMVNLELGRGEPEAALAALAPLLAVSEPQPRVIELQAELRWRLGQHDLALADYSWLADSWNVEVAQRARLARAALARRLGLAGELPPRPQSPAAPWTLVQLGRLQQALGGPMPPGLARLRSHPADVLLTDALAGLRG